MHRLLTCLTAEHDFRIVLIAVFICAATAVTALKTYDYALGCGSRTRQAWLASAGITAASGIWGTHFIAMLAYQPNIPTGYSLELTALSLVLAGLATTLGFSICARKDRNSVITGGAVIGLGITLMHYTGMQALEVPGHLTWDAALAAISIVIGIGLAIAAMLVCHSETQKNRLALSSALLVLAIAGMHFTAMAAAQIIPDPTIEISVRSIDRIVLAPGLCLVISITLCAGAVAVVFRKMQDELQSRTAALTAEVADRCANSDRLKQQQTILGDIMRSIEFRHGTLNDAISKLNETAAAYSKIDVSYVYTVDPNGETLTPLDFHDRRLNQKFFMQSVPVEYFAASGDMSSMTEAAVFTDLQNDPRITAGRLEYTIARDMRAAIDLPIAIDGRVVGVYCVRACGKAHDWAGDEKLFATSLANLASLAFERRERQKVEDELRQANDAALAASKAKSQFLANMSHEIRTPMNGVFGMTDLLARTALDDRQKRLVSSIGQSARTLLTIINDILDLSRIEEGKLSLDYHDFYVANCIEDAVALLADEAQKKDVDLNLFIDEAAFGTAKGDSVRLRQVMLNLVGNAVKFTSQGEVTIRAVPSAALHPAAGLRIEVRDTGIGIDNKVVDMLFKPFAQADSSISRRFGGTGLGLSISRHLVSMMGGEMKISSELGKGTCVSFELPLEIVPSESNRTKPSRDVLAGQRILVVDDRATNREIICSYLAAAGVQAESAENGEQALAMLDAAANSGRPFVQAIVDMIMPGIDGLELCRRISSAPKTQATQLVLLSSLSWSQDLGVAREAGIERLLHKPIRRNELVGVVTELLTRRQNPGLKDATAENFGHDAVRNFNLRVLVAEDNPVNQVIASEYLANLGCQPTVVENGLQALAAFEREHFDAILMDCQMPEMDGLTATRQIRERERELSLPATPIIAVTANAYEEDRRRCLDAGMNHYVRKPFSEDDLAAALEHIRPAPAKPSAILMQIKPAKTEAGQNDASKTDASKTGTENPAHDVAAAADCSVIDEKLKNSRPGLYAKLITTYIDHAPKLMLVMTRAMRLKDLNALMLAVHSLKSSSANVGAVNLSELCRRLEIAAKAAETATCAALVPLTECGVVQLCAKLENELQNPPASVGSGAA